MSSSSTPRSEPTGRSSLATPRLWTFASRSRRWFVLPRRGSGEWTPALLILALLAVLVVQFALPGATEPPESSSLAPRRTREPVAPMIPDYSAVLRAPIFAPDRRPGETTATAGASVATSLQILGVAEAGRSAQVVVRTPDGAAHVLQPGQTLQGWRLVAAAADAAVFIGPAGRVSLPVGGPPTANPTSPTTPKAGQTTASEPPP